mgnify:CR=1 FL=1
MASETAGADTARRPGAPAGDPVLLREDKGAIAWLTLNRPAQRNSLSEALLRALAETFEAIGRDPAIKAVVLAGNGPAFCAGHDLKELTAHRGDADRAAALVRARPLRKESTSASHTALHTTLRIIREDKIIRQSLG